mmetsp:Transcript_1152/g.1363  ORF Transcript_1152/g.1363 Transcript_1152/m.1363 type:complete len:201 (+) Transcript_1152:160-762(+)
MALSATEEHCRYCFQVLQSKLEAENRTPPNPEFDNSVKAPLFITWSKKEDGEEEFTLRGCIGNFQDLDLHKGIREYALISALEDSRFPPVTFDELPALKVSVSLLVNFEDGSTWKDWEIGKHGIRISFSSGSLGRRYGATYLPEVASEQKWDHKQTLVSLIRKSGYQGAIDEKLLKRVKLVRYQSSKCSMTYKEYKMQKS